MLSEVKGLKTYIGKLKQDMESEAVNYDKEK